MLTLRSSRITRVCVCCEAYAVRVQRFVTAMLMDRSCLAVIVYMR